ncbi:putative membrane protein [Asticcacaulis biprosthecium C19]|uniref:Putative membrane protein n=1 Tax=Asticcacaulis biprosthecium C19 TaxID=715226 RepID=F4QKA9_9CAUL|nr:hypothetical protein [Asticcacaulis biprosthecium]EGF93287.1 putative membrane protein [Asticcacaulis biprosthecium C19]
MVDKISKIAGPIVWLAYVLIQVFDVMKHSNSWLEFIWPFGAALGYFAANMLILRFPRVAGAILIATTTVLVVGLLIEVVEHWQFFADNWAITLIVLYLPVMLLLWFGYQKLEQRRK